MKSFFNRFPPNGLKDSDFSESIYKLTVEFANDITSATGGVVSKSNPKQITFESDLNKEIVFFATTNKDIKAEDIDQKIIEENINAMLKSRPVISQCKVKAVKKKKATVKLQYTKVKGIKYNIGYEVQYAANKKFKNARTKRLKKSSIKIKGLKIGKKYYFRVRYVILPEEAYIKVTKIGKYSKVKSVFVKNKK